jgi:hypothetical protein
LPDGSKLPLPPVIFGTLGEDKSKKTVLIYGHLDVQPAEKSDGWNTEPFELTEKDGKLFGRGSTDDKGPVLGWINAIEVLNDLKVQIPVNIKVNYLYSLTFTMFSSSSKEWKRAVVRDWMKFCMRIRIPFSRTSTLLAFRTIIGSAKRLLA